MSILRHTDAVAPRSIRGVDWTNHTIAPTYGDLAVSAITRPWHILLRYSLASHHTYTRYSHIDD